MLFPLVLLLLGFQGAFGQSLQGADLTPLRIDTALVKTSNIGTAEGLPAGLVFMTAQNADGFLWMATRHGLARYDGYGVKVFQHDPADPYSLPDNDIHTVVAGSNNLLWIETGSKGSGVFDPVFERWYPLDVPLHEFVEEDDWGNLWVHGDDSIWRIVPQSVKPYRDDPLGPVRFPEGFEALTLDAVIPGLLLPRKSSLQHGPDGLLWVATLDSIFAFRLFQTGETTQRLWGVAHPRRLIDPAKTIVMPYKTGSDHALMMLPYAVVRLPVNGGKPKTTATLPFGANERLRAAVRDLDGRIWIAFSSGVYRYDPADKRFAWVLDARQPFADDGRPRSFTVFNLNLDRQGNVLMSSNGYGCYVVERSLDRFLYSGDGHLGPSITSLMPLSKGGVAAYDFGEAIQYQVEGSAIVQKGLLYRLGENYTVHRVVYQDEDAPSWFEGSTQLHQSCGLLLHHPQNAVLQKTFAGAAVPLGTANARPPWSRVVHQSEDTVWSMQPFWLDKAGYSRSSAVRRVELFRYVRSTPERFELFAWQSPKGGGNMHLCMGSVVIGNRHLWMAFQDGGLLHCDLAALDREVDAWVHYEPSPDGQGIPDYRILSIIKDPVAPDRKLYLGTTQGLVHMDIEREEFRTISVEEGLPDKTVYGILVDDRKALWLSTNKGLCRYTPSTGQTLSFYQEDGLQHNEFNRFAYARDTDGWMWFGGVGGMTAFHPDRFYTEEAPAQTKFLEFRIMNKVVGVERSAPDVQSPDGVADRPPSIPAPMHATTSISRHQRERMWTFSFARLDMRRPERQRYRFRLQGFTDAWVESGSNNEAAFTNLSAGRYVLEVQSQDAQGRWDPNAARLAFRVRPYWYATWWFAVLAGLVLAGLVYGLFRYRTRQQEKVQRLRNRISRDLHDEIGSTMSSIALFGTVAKKRLDGAPQEAGKMLDRINASTTQVMESINDIVWAIKSSNDEGQQVVQRMRSFLAQSCEAAGVAFAMDVESGLDAIPLSMAYRRNAYLIFKEATNNALKYAQSPHIEVVWKRAGSALVLEVRDAGRGFDPEALKQMENLGGNGLGNMRQRAKEINGQLRIESRPGEGTLVVFTASPKAELKAQ